MVAVNVHKGATGVTFPAEKKSVPHRFVYFFFSKQDKSSFSLETASKDTLTVTCEIWSPGHFQFTSLQIISRMTWDVTV